MAPNVAGLEMSVAAIPEENLHLFRDGSSLTNTFMCHARFGSGDPMSRCDGFHQTLTSDEGRLAAVKRVFEMLAEQSHHVDDCDEKEKRLQDAIVDHLSTMPPETVHRLCSGLEEGIIVMNDDNTGSGASKRDGLLRSMGGKICRVDPKLIELMTLGQPTNLGASRVADFNDNLSFAFQEGRGLQGVLQNAALAKVRQEAREGETEGSPALPQEWLDLIDAFESALQAVLYDRDVEQQGRQQPQPMEYQGSFMRTEHTVPQPAHVDYPWDILREDSERLYIGFFPLTEHGMFIQLWDEGDDTVTASQQGDAPTESIPGQLVYIPYGTLLMVPSNTIHAGGFRSLGSNGNLRFHLYIATNGASLPKFQRNVYTERNDRGRELCDRFVDSKYMHDIHDLLFET